MFKRRNNMSKNIDDIYKEMVKNTKDISNLDSKVSKEMADLKKLLKSLDKKISLILEKVQEFEIVMDAAEILEEHMEEEEDKYNTEWNPYEDNEDYEDYENNSDDVDL
jgi:DNA anti-recombination protein RmuC